MNNIRLDRVNRLLSGGWIDISIVCLAFLAWGATFLQLARGGLHFSTYAQVGIFILGSSSLGVIAWLTRTCSVPNYLFQWLYASC